MSDEQILTSGTPVPRRAKLSDIITPGPTPARPADHAAVWVTMFLIAVAIGALILAFRRESIDPVVTIIALGLVIGPAMLAGFAIGQASMLNTLAARTLDSTIIDRRGFVVSAVNPRDADRLLDAVEFLADAPEVPTEVTRSVSAAAARRAGMP